jgi:hypothetical protein
MSSVLKTSLRRLPVRLPLWSQLSHLWMRSPTGEPCDRPARAGPLWGAADPPAFRWPADHAEWAGAHDRTASRKAPDLSGRTLPRGIDNRLAAVRRRADIAFLALLRHWQATRRPPPRARRAYFAPAVRRISYEARRTGAGVDYTAVRRRAGRTRRAILLARHASAPPIDVALRAHAFALLDAPGHGA